MVVIMLRNGDFLKIFESIQDTHRFLKTFVENESDNGLYDVINYGLDNHKSWLYKGDVYDFRTRKEDRVKRQFRKTKTKDV